MFTATRATIKLWPTGPKSTVVRVAFFEIILRFDRILFNGINLTVNSFSLKNLVYLIPNLPKAAETRKSSFILASKSQSNSQSVVVVFSEIVVFLAINEALIPLKPSQAKSIQLFQ